MSWGEALRLIKFLRADTSSQTAAALEGWDFPVDRGYLAMLDVFDVMVLANSDPKKGRPKPHGGRPWKTANRQQQHIGDTSGRSRESVVAILRDLGHNIPV